MAKRIVMLMLVVMVAAVGQRTVKAEVAYEEKEETELTQRDFNTILCNEQIPLLIDKFKGENWHFTIRGAKEETPSNRKILGVIEEDDLTDKLIKMADSHRWVLNFFVQDDYIGVNLNKTDSSIWQGDVLIYTVYSYNVLYTEKIFYRVAKGDTLSEIAEKFNIAVQEIVDLNKFIEDPNLIYYDTYLQLPVTATTNEKFL